MTIADVDRARSVIDGWKRNELMLAEAIDLLTNLDIGRRSLVAELLLAIPLDPKE